MSQTEPLRTPAEGAPAAPGETRARRPRMGPAYWAGLTFGAVCIFLGIVLGLWGARIAPADPASRAPVPAVLPQEPAQPAPPAPAAPSRFSRPAPAPGPSATPSGPPVDTQAPSLAAADPLVDPRTAALETRLAEAEAARKGSAQAAAAALAISALAQAAEGGGPFVAEVEKAAAAVPASPDLDALRALAAVGAPSRPSLAAAFPTAAARAAVAARQPGPRAGLGDRVAYVLSGMITLRRTDRLTGPGADAVLARAGRAVDEGDLAGAVRELATLGPAARAAVGPWRADAERRLAIERRIAALRAGAAASLRSPAG